MSLYDTLEKALFSKSIDEKRALVSELYDAVNSQKCVIDNANATPKKLDMPSFAGFCRIVAPFEVIGRQDLSTKEGLGAFIHAVVHIEFCAIDLALDHAYRFVGMPCEYYADWIEVAAEEVRHFDMLVDILRQIGFYYGDFPVHTALFEAMIKTDTLLQRMAVIPRYLEANGLDANAKLVSKVQNLPKTPVRDAILSCLGVILKDEISHVAKGDRWFKYACKKEGSCEFAYTKAVKEVYPSAFEAKNKSMNIKARIAAGFTQEELEALCNPKSCSDMSVTTL